MKKGEITSGGEGIFLWEIKDFGIPHRDGFCVKSPPFTFTGVEYRIKLQRQKQSYFILTILYRPDNLPLSHVSFECQVSSGEESVSPSYTVTPDGRTHYARCGVDIYGYLSKRNNSFLFPCLTLSLRMEDGRTHLGFTKLQEDFKKLVLSEEDSDVTLKVQGIEFPAHKAILRARSPVFYAMFGHDMAEKLSGGVTIEDCDPKTFPDFLHYLYTGSTEHVSGGNVCHLYTTSDKYEVLELKTQCTEFMKIHFSIETFCDFLTLALKYEDGDLIRAATEYFCANAVEIVKSTIWQIFHLNNPTVGNELVLKALSREKTI